VLIVDDSEAGTRWMSEDLYKRTANKDKKLHIVKGGTHISITSLI